MKRRCTGYVLAAGLAVSGAVVGTPGQASAATTIYVAEAGTDGPGCGAETSPCATVYQGVTEAKDQNADIIKVGPGTYEMNRVVAIQKEGLTLEGAKYGQDARKRTPEGGGETIITGTTPYGDRANIWVQANDVTIDGFDFEGNAGGAGIYSDYRWSGYTVSHDIFHNNLTGLLSASSGGFPSVFDQNLYAENNNPDVLPGGEGDAVFEYEYLRNASFTNSTFVGNVSASINLPGSFGQVQNITIADNDMTDDGGIVLVNDSEVVVARNQMNRGYVGVNLAGGDSSVTIEDNSIIDKAHGGIRVNADYFSAPGSGVTVMHNTITGSGAPGISVADGGYTGAMTVQNNRIVNSEGHQGLINDAADATIDAPLNWWGCNDMSDGTRCDQVEGIAAGQVTYQPWLIMTMAPEKPSDIFNAAKKSIDVTLNSDSEAATHEPPIFAPVPVDFAATVGTIKPASTTSDELLHASATWEATGTGPGKVCATIDNQELCREGEVPASEQPPGGQPPGQQPPTSGPPSAPGQPSVPRHPSAHVRPVRPVRARVPVTG